MVARRERKDVDGPGLESPYEYANPIVRYEQLPVWKREWLEALSKEDIERLEDQRKFFSKVETSARVFKWLIVTILGALVFGATVVKAVNDMWHLFHGGTK